MLCSLWSRTGNSKRWNIQDCLQQYITNRCWLIESGLGNTASISFPPPLPSFFSCTQNGAQWPRLLGIPDVCWDTVTLTPYPSATPHSPFIFSRYIISFHFTTVHHTHISLRVSFWYFGARREDNLLPSPFTGGKQTSCFYVYVCDFYFACHSPLHFNKIKRMLFLFVVEKQIILYKSWYKWTKLLNKHGRNTFIYAIS